MSPAVGRVVGRRLGSHALAAVGAVGGSGCPASGPPPFAGRRGYKRTLASSASRAAALAVSSRPRPSGCRHVHSSTRWLNEGGDKGGNSGGAGADESGGSSSSVAVSAAASPDGPGAGEDEIWNEGEEWEEGEWMDVEEYMDVVRKREEEAEHSDGTEFRAPSHLKFDRPWGNIMEDEDFTEKQPERTIVLTDKQESQIDYSSHPRYRRYLRVVVKGAPLTASAEEVAEAFADFEPDEVKAIDTKKGRFNLYFSTPARAEEVVSACQAKQLSIRKQPLTVKLAQKRPKTAEQHEMAYRANLPSLDAPGGSSDHDAVTDLEVVERFLMGEPIESLGVGGPEDFPEFEESMQRMELRVEALKEAMDSSLRPSYGQPFDWQEPDVEDVKRMQAQLIRLKTRERNREREAKRIADLRAAGVDVTDISEDWAAQEEEREEFEELEDEEHEHDSDPEAQGKDFWLRQDEFERASRQSLPSRMQLLMGNWGEVIVDTGRVSKKVATGSINRFRALVVVGNGNGVAGFGTGKSGDLKGALIKAQRDAKRNLIYVPRFKHRALLHDLHGKHNNLIVNIFKRPVGGGLHAGTLVEEILKLFGIADATAKTHGRRNPYSIVRATFNALAQHKGLEEMALGRGVRVLSLVRDVNPYTMRVDNMERWRDEAIIEDIERNKEEKQRKQAPENRFKQ